MWCRSLFLAFWLSVPGAHAIAAEEFGANNLVASVSTDNALQELTPDFEPVREVQIPQTVEVEGPTPCLLPDGTVVIAIAGGLARLDADGNVLQTISLQATPTGITGGPDGLAFVVAGGELLEVDLESGESEKIQIPQTVELEGPAPCLLPDGTLLIAIEGGVAVVDRTGNTLQTISLQATPTGLAAGPGGSLIVTTASGIAILDLSGTVLLSSDIAGTGFPSLLPNGLLAVREQEPILNEPVHETDLLLIDFDLDAGTATVVNEITEINFEGFTTVPFRFRVRLKGDLGINANPEALESIDQPALLTVASGASGLMLALPEDSTLATVFDTERLTLAGVEAPAGEFAPHRLLQGAQVPPTGTPGQPLASVAVRVSGNSGENNFFEIEEGQGSLHIALGHAIFNGRVKLGKSLN